jgi:hypothetical protein
MIKIVTFHYVKGLFWIRFGTDGPGISVKDTRIHPLMFSQRNNLSKFYLLGPWCFKFLDAIK